MSKYDQRMLNITSNILYFQLIPKTLTNLSPSQYTIDKLTLTLLKGQHIIDRTKRSVPLINNGYVGTISHAFINFDVSCNGHQYDNQQYTIIVHGSMINQIKVDHEQSQEVAEVFFQVGQFRIPVGDYIAQFLESGKTLFCQRFKLNNQLTLDMQIHTQRIRFMLQKNVRQTNHYQHANSPQKQQKQSKIKFQQTQFDKKSTNNQNLIIILPRTKSQQIYHKDNSPTEENQKNQSYCYQIAQENIQEMIHDQLNAEDFKQQGRQRGEDGKQKQQEQSQVSEEWQKQKKLQKECSQENVQLLESGHAQQVQEKYEQNGQIQINQEVKIQGSEPKHLHIFQQRQEQQHGQNQLSEQLLQEQEHLWGQGQEQQSENKILSKQQQRQHEQSQLEGGTVQFEQKKYTQEHQNVQYRQQEQRQTIETQNQQLQGQIQQAQEHELLQQIQTESNLLRQEYEKEQKQKQEQDQHEGQQQYYKDQEQEQKEQLQQQLQQQEQEQEEEKMEQTKQKQGKLRIEAKQKEKDEFSLNGDKQRKRAKQQQRLEADSGCLLEHGRVSSEKVGKQEEINKRGEQIKRKDEKSEIGKKGASILKKQVKKEEPVSMRAQRVGREQTDIRNNNNNNKNANANVRVRVQRNQQASNHICRRVLICLIICSIVLLFYSSSSNSKTDFV